MCGECTEKIVLYGMEMESRGKRFNIEYAAPFTNLFLQETNDLAEGIKQVKANYSFKNLEGSTENIVILCRAIEILYLYGFDSSIYQELIGCDIVREVIENECNSKKNKVGVAIQGIAIIDELYIADTYLDKNSYLSFHKKIKGYVHKCIDLVSFYSDRWLEGNNLRQNDDSKGWHGHDDGEWQKFISLFPSLFFSIIMLGNTLRYHDVLMNVITKQPVHTPDFESLELWLQRKAMCKLIEIKGTSFIEPNITNIRVQHIYYSAVKMKIKRKKRKLLSDAILLSIPNIHPESDEYTFNASLDAMLSKNNIRPEPDKLTYAEALSKGTYIFDY